MIRRPNGTTGEKKANATRTRNAKTRPRAKAEERINWEGIELAIGYEANWLNGQFDVAHLEVQVIAPKGAILPITDTGYRSHFLARAKVESVGGPVAYCRAWLDHAAKSPEWKRREQKSRQLCLL